MRGWEMITGENYYYTDIFSSYFYNDLVNNLTILHFSTNYSKELVSTHIPKKH